MKCFVINLDSATKRLAHWTEQWNKWGGGKYERFSAVNGKQCWKTLPKVWNGKTAQWWQWIRNGRCLTKSEVGCAASHLSIYEKMIKEQIPYVAIFEDDMVFCSNIGLLFSKLEQVLNPQIPCVYLLSTGEKDGDFRLASLKTEVCAGGYVVTLAAAERLLKLNTPLSVPVDAWGRWRMLGVELMKCEPRLCGHWARTEFGSMMDNEKDKRNGIGYKIWFYSIRIVDRVLLRVYSFILALKTKS